MDTAYMTKDELNNLINITKKIPKWKFVLAKFKWFIKIVFLSLALALAIIVVFFSLNL